MAPEYPIEIQRIIGRFERDWPRTIDVGPGWYPLLGRLDARLSAIAPCYVVQQVKSKFGALSFFARGSDDPYDYNEVLQNAVRAAEWESTEICEECGAAARTYVIRLWVWTVCEAHAREKRRSLT